ncbi:MAG TPA: hypothetical protein VKP66_13920 [Steroidobacteraceae bacterium]|nr:hypothetical protein [Steroidobacteraceae bacterium]
MESVMITVWSGSSPPRLERLRVPELAHLDVFTSRSSEEGRERYRLHVGYFADPAVAERVLPRVREIYPSAWVVPASRHRPLARLKALAMRAWTAEPDSRPAPNALLPRAAPLEPSMPEFDVDGAPASGLTAGRKSAVDAPLGDEASLDPGEILALLEASDSPAPSLPNSLAADSGQEVPPREVELVPVNQVNEVDASTAPPKVQMMGAERAEGADATSAPPPAASPELLRPLSRLSVEVWCAEAPVAAEPMVARSWLKRLSGLTRLIIPCFHPGLRSHRIASTGK